MALQKLITLPNGICGSYIRVGDSYEMNRREESVTAHVTLFSMRLTLRLDLIFRSK